MFQEMIQMITIILLVLVSDMHLDLRGWQLNTTWKKDPTYAWLKKELKKTYRYYYERMCDDYKGCYKKIFNAVLSFETTVKLPLMDVLLCEKIYSQFIFDNPLFFFVDSVYFGVGPLGIVININYSMNELKTAATLKIIKSVLENISSVCRSYSELEKEEYIHRYLIEQVQYELNDSLPVHSAHSVFVNKKAVCDGISKAAKVLMDSVGIHSIVISGDSFHPNSPSSGGGHAWNIVWIANKPYHVDFTFDNNLSDKGKLIRYDYFNLSEDQIRRDHTYESVGVDATFLNDWFRANNMYFDKKKAVKMYVRTGIQNKVKNLGFRIPFTSNPDKTLSEIKELITTEIKENAIGSISYSLAINKGQMVVYILF